MSKTEKKTNIEQKELTADEFRAIIEQKDESIRKYKNTTLNLRESVARIELENIALVRMLDEK